MNSGSTTSKGNSLVKLARELRRGRQRKESPHFLIEGLQPIGMAMEAGWPIEALIYSPQLLRSAFGRALVERHRGQLAEVPASVIHAIAMKENPQGIVAVARKKAVPLEDVSPGFGGIALLHPQDAGNVGTVVRSLEAVGASPLYLLDGGVDAYHPTVIRASMGASFFVPAVECSFSRFVSWVGDKRIFLVGTSARAPSPFTAISPPEPWILLLGNEQKGLTDAQQSACDAMVSLPMHGRISSLNLAVAASILLYSYST